MAGRKTADVIFCLDASGSMGPCFEELKDTVQNFVKGLESGLQVTWDVRFDFLAYQAGEVEGRGVFEFRTLKIPHGMEVLKALYHGSGQQGGGSFFTSSIPEFCEGLKKVNVGGDEASFIALDTALDFPWRPDNACHRVVILMTDEELETGVLVDQQKAKIPELISKLTALRVKLYLVGPSSSSFAELCSADKCEYMEVSDGHDGLKNADFAELMSDIGKSVSVSASSLQMAPTIPPPKGLFGQPSWVASQLSLSGS